MERRCEIKKKKVPTCIFNIHIYFVVVIRDPRLKSKEK